MLVLQGNQRDVFFVSACFETSPHGLPEKHQVQNGDWGFIDRVAPRTASPEANPPRGPRPTYNEPWIHFGCFVPGFKIGYMAAFHLNAQFTMLNSLMMKPTKLKRLKGRIH